MRDSDVRDLLEHVDNHLATIKDAYQRALQSKEVPATLRIDIKNAMENLRSALDYMAHDIAEVVVAPHRVTNNLVPIRRVYFPYGRDKQAFEESSQRTLPDLRALNLRVFDIIAAIQPHTCGDMWLYDFCSTLNDNKHDALSAQERSERKSYKIGRAGGGPTISAPAGAIKAPPGAISIGGAPVTFDPSTGIPVQTPGLDVQVVTWVSFKFKDTNVEVYPLIEAATTAIRRTSEQLYEELT